MMLLLDRVLGPVDVLDEVDQPARVMEGAVLDLVRRTRLRPPFSSADFGASAVSLTTSSTTSSSGHPLVGEVDRQTLVEECHLLQPARHRLEVVVRSSRRCSESAQNRIVVPVFLVASPCLRVPGTDAVVGLRPLVAVACDLHLESAGQRVDHRHTDAVQTTADSVAAVSPPNLPPACSWVITTSTVGTPVACIATGMPRPLSATWTLPSSRIVTSTRCRRSRPSPRRPSCRRPPRSSGAVRAHRWTRCTCRGVCGLPPAPRER